MCLGKTLRSERTLCAKAKVDRVRFWKSVTRNQSGRDSCSRKRYRGVGGGTSQR
jgi:hypothetical protein